MGNKIAFLRIEHDMTQKALATKAGVAIHALGYAENHTCGVDMGTKIAESLGENVFNVMGSDVLKILPKTDEDKEILIKVIKEL